MSGQQIVSATRTGRIGKLFQNQHTAWVILALSMALTAAAWVVTHQAVRTHAEQRFDFQTQQLEEEIHDRMILYEQVLWGGVGLFDASGNVSRSEWFQYVDAIDITAQWPGIQGLGFSVPLDPDQLEEHTASIRAEGFPEYQVWPEDPREEYSSIIYLEPFDERNQRAFGFDMWSNNLRREAMTRARDTGKAITSSAITLVQETEDDIQKGFLTYVPVYTTDSTPDTVVDRQANFEGWVYAPFRIRDLMEGIGSRDSENITFIIYDGLETTEDHLLLDSSEAFGHPRGSDDGFTSTGIIHLQGRDWTITYQSGPGFVGQGESIQPTVIAFGGIIINGLLLYLITSLVSSNRQVKRANEQLAERSYELENYTEQLEQSNAELEQFAYVASHDLQEPLRNLGSYAKLLSQNYEDQLGAEGERWLGYITESSHRMSKLLRDLLNYASVEAIVEEPEPVDLNQVMAVVLTDLQQVVTDSKTDITIDELPTVMGDEFQLQRLFQNLISNAIKYRNDEGVHRVWVGVSDSADEWRFSVRDSGIGIKPEYHDRIFEIFKRVSRRSKYQGTGIGLAVCRKVVAMHGGSIGVNSTPGHGSVFWFTLPRVPMAGNTPNQTRPRELAVGNFL